MRGFGRWRMDYALYRPFNIVEQIDPQFRGEFSSGFKHPNVSSVNTSGGSSFGRAATKPALLHSGGPLIQKK
jgi:hypothetical protein